MQQPQPPISEEDLTWVRWNDAAYERHPEIRSAIDSFDPGPRAAAQASASWLRESGLSNESVAYLALLRDPWKLVGFYALTMGQVELTSGHRKQVDVRHPTQGAVVITQLAKSAQHRFSGSILLSDAIGTAIELSETIGATVVALDPFDRETDAMWRTRFAFRRSRTELRTCDEEGPLKRLWLPMKDPVAGI